MDLPVPPGQIRDALSDREAWTSFVKESVGQWRRRFRDFGPDELRKSAEDLRRRIEDRESRADDVMSEAVNLAREIASYADLDQETAVQQLRRIVFGLPRKILSLEGKPIHLWEKREVYSEAAPGDRFHIERLVKRIGKLHQENQHDRFSLRIVEHVHRQYLNGALQLNEDDPPEREQPLTTILTHSERRLEWIGQELMSRGKTWKERYDELEKICEREGVSMPYKNPESLRKSFNQSEYG